MKSLQELKELRNKSLKKMSMRYIEGGFRIQIGMGTCGISSGAKPILSEFLEQVEINSIQNVAVTQVGCMGECSYEPMAEIVNENGQSFVYCNLTKGMVKAIIEQHIMKNEPIDKFLLTSKKG